MRFRESNLEFTFDEHNWWAIKFDEHINYTKVGNSLSGTKAIDFLGIYNDDTLIFFEVKNFRNHTSDPSTRARLAQGAEDLTTEIAQKVRDSIACIVAAGRNTTHNPTEWAKASRIISTGASIKVIAWVEEDMLANTTYYKQKIKAHLSVRISNLKNKLHWLNAKVSMESIKNPQITFDGFSVSYINP